MKSREKWFTLPVICGLVALLCALGYWVVKFPPIKRSALDAQRLVIVHESICHFFEGKARAQRVFQETSVRWSRNIIDPDTGCVQLLDGYWLAHGWVEVNRGGTIKTYPWVTCFQPGGGKTLFIGSGLQSMGDFRAMMELELRSRKQGPLIGAGS